MFLQFLCGFADEHSSFIAATAVFALDTVVMFDVVICEKLGEHVSLLMHDDNRVEYN